ncbi:MAG: ribosomal L7Ae/L30e/S12e/Gadd45 family protein [Clostridiales bacterium]|nr:ribosomal L7Ae/L30e/S12e/Gadd45 family protein [Clostridiales bacterium]
MTSDGEEKILRFIGLAARAGQAVSGSGACEETLKNGKAHLLIVAKDISRNSMDKILDWASAGNRKTGKAINCFSFSTVESLGYAIGKSNRAAIVITDEGFARKLEEMLEGYKEDI